MTATKPTTTALQNASAQASDRTTTLVIRAERASDVAAREALLDVCFGPNRFARTCQRLRDGRVPAHGLAFSATLGGKLAGTVAEPILGKQAKLDTLNAVRARMGLAPSETLAVGDGANDLAMLGAAGLGVAFHAKPQVAAEAHACIDHGDLSALLYLQGYRRAEFVS